MDVLARKHKKDMDDIKETVKDQAKNDKRISTFII